MSSLDFPLNPVDGQEYSLNGVTYYYNAALGAWLTKLSSAPLPTAFNRQVLFNDAGLSNGSYGLVFDKSANTLFANTINVSSNIRVFGNLQIGTGTVTITNNSISAASIIVDGSAIPSGAAANLAFDTANAAYAAANNVGPQIAPTYNTANAAFGKANTALQNTTGTFFGNLTLTGNLDLSLSTSGMILPIGNTAQRPANTNGLIRFNTTTGYPEYYASGDWFSMETPPFVSNFSGIINENTSSTITVTGTGFKTGSVIYVSGAAVSYVDRALTTTIVSSTQLTANTNASSVFFTGGAAFDIKVVNPSGQTSILSNAGTIDRDPLWSTSAGNLTTINDRYGSYSPITTVSASDPEGTSVTYGLSSGSLPAGTSLNTSSGAISGDPDDVIGSTTSTFTLSANSNNQLALRSFNIIVNRTDDGTSSARSASSAQAIRNFGITTSGYYYVTFNSAARYVYCDLSGSTAWILAMKTNGDSTFGWSSSYWTDSNGLNDTSDPTTNTNIKNSAVWNNYTAQYIRLTGSSSQSGYNSNPTTDFGVFNNTCYNIWRAGDNVYNSEVNWGRSNWINWANSIGGMGTNQWDNQPNCNEDRVNANFTYHRVRFGISFNNEGDCNTNDAGIGMGQYRNGMSEIGGIAVRWNGDQNFSYPAWLWVR